MRSALLFPLLLLALPLAGGCGGDEAENPNDSEVNLTYTSSEYNGDSSNFRARLNRNVGSDQTTLTVSSGSRQFQIVLDENVLKKGQGFSIGDEATATYEEGSDKVWIAVGGRATVTEEILGKFTVKLRDFTFEPEGGEDNQALGTLGMDGTLVRR